MNVRETQSNQKGASSVKNKKEPTRTRYKEIKRKNLCSSAKRMKEK